MLRTQQTAKQKKNRFPWCWHTGGAVRSLSPVWLFVIPWTAVHEAPLSSSVSRSLLKFMSIESVMLSNPLILCCPLLFAFSLSQHQGLFQWVHSLHQVAKVLELQQQSFQWIFRVDFLQGWLAWSLCISRDSQESSPAQTINRSMCIRGDKWF